MPMPMTLERLLRPYGRNAAHALTAWGSWFGDVHMHIAGAGWAHQPAHSCAAAVRLIREPKRFTVVYRHGAETITLRGLLKAGGDLEVLFSND